jgi:iron complex outermembrane receptor protein
MKKHVMLFLVTVLGFGLVLWDLPLANAQGDDTDEFTLEEITVTAQKREENLQKVPIAMEVVSADEIREFGVTNLEEILSSISTVMVSAQESGMLVSIRSISDDKGEGDGLPLGTPIVGVNVDGVFSNRMSSGQGYYDLERVEVLFGPQSTMYASSSPGGMVNIITADPKIDRYEVSGALEYGNYARTRFEGMVNAPISETVALRAAFNSLVHDGYLSNGASDTDRRAARLKAKFQPNDWLSFIITGEKEKTQGHGFTSVVNFAREGDVSDPWTAAPGFMQQTADLGPPFYEESQRIYMNINADLGFGLLTLVPAKTERDIDRTTESMPAQIEDPMITRWEKDSGWEKGVEGRLASPVDSPIDWIIGFNWYKSDYVQCTNNSIGEWSDNYREMGIQAAYGNIVYPVTDRFRAAAGLRYTEDTNDSETYQYPPRPDAPANTLDRYPGIQYMEDYITYKEPNYKLGFEYDLGENSMVYLDYATSYRTQRGKDPRGVHFDPEYLKAFTVGSKNRFLGNKLQVNASGYYYRYDNYMTIGRLRSIWQKDINGDGDYDDLNQWDEEYQTYRDEYIVGLADPAGTTVGDGAVMGADIQTSWIISDKDQLDVSVSYLYTEFLDMYLDYWDSTNDLGIVDQDYTGQKMTNSPTLTMNAAYSHNFHLQNGDILTARIDGKYQSEYFLSYNDKLLQFDRDWNPIIRDVSDFRTQEAYYIINLGATYASEDGKWSLSGYVRNLTNYAVKTAFSMMGGGLHVGPPRFYGAILSVKY